ncbi:MAG: adenosylcobinamide-GDP ribazoletransferase, partial [Chloroflexota bacterium]
AFGRWVAVVAMVIVSPLDQPGSLAKDIGQRPGLAILSGASLLVLPFLVPLASIALGALLVGTGCALLFLLWFRQLMMRHLGGVTGDCLGFAVYAAQLILLLCVVTQCPPL